MHLKKYYFINKFDPYHIKKLNKNISIIYRNYNSIINVSLLIKIKNFCRKNRRKFYLSNNYQKEVNYFKIKSGQSQEEWDRKGWIHKDDPRGWFEWYCKFFNGRRHEDDERQIKRWLAFCGPRGRFRNSIYNKIFKSGLDIENSKTISPRIQQSLLHWSYIVNNEDYESWKLEKQK